MVDRIGCYRHSLIVVVSSAGGVRMQTVHYSVVGRSCTKCCRRVWQTGKDSSFVCYMAVHMLTLTFVVLVVVEIVGDEVVKHAAAKLEDFGSMPPSPCLCWVSAKLAPNHCDRFSAEIVAEAVDPVTAPRSGHIELPTPELRLATLTIGKPKVWSLARSNRRPSDLGASSPEVWLARALPEI